MKLPPDPAEFSPEVIDVPAHLIGPGEHPHDPMVVAGAPRCTQRPFRDDLECHGGLQVGAQDRGDWY